MQGHTTGRRNRVAKHVKLRAISILAFRPVSKNRHEAFADHNSMSPTLPEGCVAFARRELSPSIQTPGSPTSRAGRIAQSHIAPRILNAAELGFGRPGVMYTTLYQPSCFPFRPLGHSYLSFPLNPPSFYVDRP